VQTTERYLDADLALKEKALAKTNPRRSEGRFYRPDDELLGFLIAPRAVFSGRER
jgi:integrase/recombinase XerD